MSTTGKTDAARPTPEQELAIRAQADYVLVSAGAGTGKTRTLIERVLWELHEGTPLERLLVITFTQKAAQQVQQKLYEAFRRDARLRPLRLLLAQSHVSTIDAFCARLLREQAVSAGIDPDFRVLADPHDQLVIAELLNEIFHHWYLGRPAEAPEDAPEWTGVPRRQSREHHEFLRLVELCRYREGQEVLKDEIRHLMQRARVHPDPEAFLAGLEVGLDADPPPYCAAYGELLARAWSDGAQAYETLLRIASAEFPNRDFAPHARLLAALRSAPPISGSRGASLPDTLARVRRHLAEHGLGEGGAWKLAYPRLPAGTKERLGPWNEHAKNQLRGPGGTKTVGPFSWLPEDLGEITGQYRRTADTLRTLLALLRRLMNAYESHKRERGLLDFADLELHTRRLLRDAGADLRGRFSAVLVDEFQDVNQLQADILALLEPARGRFLVGDVKQCIYQFRLSDPKIFRGLFAGATILRPGDPGTPRERARVFLSGNFRSRFPVLQAVNSFFATLFLPEMIGGEYADQALAFAASAGLPEDRVRAVLGTRPHYDEAAAPADPPRAPRAPRRANPPVPEPASAPAPGALDTAGWQPVEFHLLDKPPAELELPPDSAVVLEATLAARRIHELVSAGFPVYDERLKGWRALRHGDIAVILRSPGPTGTAYARTLREQGIPTSFGGSDFFDRQEVRDFCNLAHALDNAHDDVALAAILRAPGAELDDADLTRLRLLWPRSLYLISALRATATGTPDAHSGAPRDGAWRRQAPGQALANKSRRFLDDFDRWRALAQSADLAAALTTAVEESGLREAAEAMDGGPERAANLEHLLTIARDYVREQDHSLAGFLTHLEALRLSGAPESASAEAGAGDVVRILSLHKAKGLEFPVVVLSLLGRQFNTSDTRRYLLTGEDWIGVDILDPEEYVKTPTLAHRTLARLRLEETLSEEMRILYVAFTRAREKLIVSGTLGGPWDRERAKLDLWSAGGAPPRATLFAARRPLDWVLGVLHRHGLLDGLDASDTTAARETVTITRHSAQALAEWMTSRRAVEPGGTELAAALAALPALRERLLRGYAHEAATRQRGKLWATEVKRLLDEEIASAESEAGAELATATFTAAPASALATASASAAARALIAAPLPSPAAAGASGPPRPSPAEEGTWLHAILEAVDLADPRWSFARETTAARAAEDSAPAGMSAAARAEATAALLDLGRRLAQRGLLPASWVTPESVAPVVAFLSSPTAAEMRGAGPRLEREIAFSLKMRAAELSGLWPAAAELGLSEWILVQGRVDALWPQPGDGIVVLDFKSDRVDSPGELAERAARYRPQMLLYREAAARLWKAQRVECRLYFLRPARVVRVE